MFNVQIGCKIWLREVITFHIPLRIKIRLIFHRPANNLVRKRRPLTPGKIIKISPIIPWFERSHERSTAISLAECPSALTIRSGASIHGEKEEEDPISTTPGGRLLSSRSPRTCPRCLMQFRATEFSPVPIVASRPVTAHCPPPFSRGEKVSAGAHAEQ